MPTLDATQRFGDRVANYLRYRPSYPQETLTILAAETRLNAASIVADVGSGTGISSKLLLQSGCTLYGIEPNDEMRQAAEQFLAGNLRFQSVKGQAEATLLPDHCVTHISAAQAFHWFDPHKTRAEFLRILRPGGWVILLWNARHLKTTPFLRAYEDLLLEFGTDYRRVRHENIDEEALKRFFNGTPTRRTLPNSQSFDLKALTGRLLSSSYAPPETHPRHRPMLEALEQIFGTHQQNGQVKFEYDTQIHMGQLG